MQADKSLNFNVDTGPLLICLICDSVFFNVVRYALISRIQWNSIHWKRL